MCRYVPLSVNYEKMSVEFNDGSRQGSVLYGRFQAASDQPKMVAWLIKKGIVKSEDGANKLLIGVVFVCIAASLYFFYYASRTLF
jgi:hypothetical protein